MDLKKLDNRQIIQLVWGAALLAMGVAFFFRISEIMGRVAGIETYTPASLFIRIALYLMAFFLIGGGIKKIHDVISADNRSKE